MRKKTGEESMLDQLRKYETGLDRDWEVMIVPSDKHYTREKDDQGTAGKWVSEWGFPNTSAHILLFSAFR